MSGTRPPSMPASRIVNSAHNCTEAGYALHNLASLDHITVIGACMTATHGSGDKHGNLATVVAGLEMVTADGEVVTLSRTKDGERFRGAVVALGALGVVTKVTLDLLPTFTMQQDIYEKLPLAHVYDHFDAIMSAGYSVSLFLDWQQDWVNTVWVKQQLTKERRLEVPTSFFDATLLPSERPTDPTSNRYSTAAGLPGPWHERLPHFYLKDPLLQGNELQSEYFVAGVTKPLPPSVQSHSYTPVWRRSSVSPRSAPSPPIALAKPGLWPRYCRDSL